MIAMPGIGGIENRTLQLPAASCRESRFSRCNYSRIRSLTPQQAAGLALTPEFTFASVTAFPAGSATVIVMVLSPFTKG